MGGPECMDGSQQTRMTAERAQRSNRPPLPAGSGPPSVTVLPAPRRLPTEIWHASAAGYAPSPNLSLFAASQRWCPSLLMLPLSPVKRTESNSNQGEEPLVMIAFGSPGLMCECEWRVEQQPCAQSVM